jgi:energy-coupling factor transporter ATP-binding protein EcfA2
MPNPATSPLTKLGLRCFAITNFRTFRDRTTIELNEGVTVFHGDTGSGKSTALAAMDFFFRSLALFVTGAAPAVWTMPWSTAMSVFGRAEPLISERDRPIAASPTVLAATFTYAPATWLEIHFNPNGPNVQVEIVWAGSDKTDLVGRLFPFGSASRPLAVLDARRRPRWVSQQASGSLLAPSLAAELYALRTSKVAADRDRWRSFSSMLASFPTLRGAAITIEAGNPPELVVEYPGRIVLGLDELSSGEQELAALTAGLLLARAGIVALEEPEMGLDVRTQELWRGVCESQRDAGFVYQFIFESHAVTFDGAHVVRFRRDGDGWTHVERTVAVAEESLTRQAQERGATEVFVSPQGYTQLPEPMRREVRLGENGARVWFLRGAETWEAWPEAELERLLAEKPR